MPEQSNTTQEQIKETYNECSEIIQELKEQRERE